jgi:beta-glucanase (GH16 family)
MKLQSGIFITGILVLFSMGGCKVLTSFSKPDRQFRSEGYQLVWADEFNYKGAPDSQNWNYEIGFERNEELQWYQKDNAWCENGLLIIEGRKETKLSPIYKEGSDEWRHSRKEYHYTSSSIKTRGKHNWQYGRFVMRGKIDISEGLWPAWWTLGQQGRWPATGEIDMMEFYRGMLLANIAYMGPDRKDAWYTVKKNVDSLGGARWASKFHVWRMDWDEEAIALYVDDLLLNKVSLEKLVNQNGTGINPFKQPHYMLLNLAIGGQQGGDPSNTTFPNRFEVDYVRVYQKR